MSEESEKTYKAMSRADLEDLYNINAKMLRKWLKKVPNLNARYVRIFSPKQVKMIAHHLG